MAKCIKIQVPAINAAVTVRVSSYGRYTRIIYRGHFEDMVAVGAITPAMLVSLIERRPGGNQHTDRRRDEFGDLYSVARSRAGVEFGNISRIIKDPQRARSLPGVEDAMRTATNATQANRNGSVLRLVWSNPDSDLQLKAAMERAP
jgi:hypothetical protein